MFKPTVIGGEKQKIELPPLEKYRVTRSQTLPKPSVVLAINGQIISTRKNIFGITGKAKVGKSYLMQLILAAVLNKGESGTISSFLPKGKDKILWFDTEQSDYHVQLALHRISNLAKKTDENLIVYAFDTLETEKRMDAVETLIASHSGLGLVFIDGIADLLFDVNDIRESTTLIDKIRKIASDYDVAIGYVLHQNPSDSSKMRGHLGTTLTNKSETVIQIESCKDNDSIKLVSTTHTRNRKPEDWSFQIDDNGIPVIMEEKYEEPKKGRKPLKIHSDDEIYQMLLKVYQSEGKAHGFGYTAIYSKLQQNESLGTTKAKELVTYAKEIGLIYQDTDKKYFLK
jgi:hypothetical protein